MQCASGMSVCGPELSSLRIQLMNIVPPPICCPLAIRIVHFYSETKGLLTEGQTESFKGICHLTFAQLGFNH